MAIGAGCAHWVPLTNGPFKTDVFPDAITIESENVPLHIYVANF